MTSLELPQEMRDDYLRRSGDKEIIEADAIMHPEHGFMSYRLLPDALLLLQVYGDGSYWNLISIEMAKQIGYRTIRFATARDPRLFERKYGYSTVGVILEKEVK